MITALEELQNIVYIYTNIGSLSLNSTVFAQAWATFHLTKIL
jgi:hypothetical protein